MLVKSHTVSAALLLSSLSHGIATSDAPQNSTRYLNSTELGKRSIWSIFTPDTDLNLDFPIGYGATFFASDDCSGEPTDITFGPYVNFGCSDVCYPVGAAKSVYIEADRYSQRPFEEDGYASFENLDTKYTKVHKNGPIVVGYQSPDCRAARYVNTGRVRKGHKRACHNFIRPIYGAYLKLLKDCTDADAPSWDVGDDIQIGKMDWDVLRSHEDVEAPPEPAIEEYQSWHNPPVDKVTLPGRTKHGVVFPSDLKGLRENEKPTKYRFEIPSNRATCFWTIGTQGRKGCDTPWEYETLFDSKVPDG